MLIIGFSDCDRASCNAGCVVEVGGRRSSRGVVRRVRVRVSGSRAASYVTGSCTCLLQEAGPIEKKWAVAVFCLGSVLRLRADAE